MKNSARKFYIQPKRLVYDTLVDMMFLQGGKEILSDECRRELHYGLEMDGLSWTLRCDIYEGEYDNCRVALEVEKDVAPEDADELEYGNLERILRGQFALLDSLLLSEGYLRVKHERSCV